MYVPTFIHVIFQGYTTHFDLYISNSYASITIYQLTLTTYSPAANNQLRRGAPIWKFWFLPIPFIFCQNLPIADHRSNTDFTLTCYAVLEH